jgi:DNA-binding Lrp family transcriptional regulator
MPKAKIYLTTETGSEYNVLEKLKKIKEVKETTVGFNGISIIIEAENMTKLKDVLNRQIRLLDKVRCVTTENIAF